MKLLIAGDFYPCGRVTEIISKKKFEDTFSDIKEIVTTSDYSIVNLEFPIFNGHAKPIKKCGPSLMGDKESIDALKYMGFKCCTLANNHILDQGEHCCIDTEAILNDYGIDTVGVGKNITNASVCLLKEVQGERVAIINCCEHEFSIATENRAGANPLNPVQQYYQIKEAKAKADYVIVIVHGGIEHYQLPTPRMQETYRFFIDAGADAVINHHQHCYSGFEIYNEKHIIYGLGNFCFDDPSTSNSGWNEGFMAMFDFTGTKQSLKLFPYEQCNNAPKIQLLSEPSNNAFFEKIAALNLIIENNDVLQEKFTEFQKNTSDQYAYYLSPYTGRITKALYKRGFLPKFLRHRKQLQLQAIIQCESHRERLLAFLKDHNHVNR